MSDHKDIGTPERRQRVDKAHTKIVRRAVDPDVRMWRRHAPLIATVDELLPDGVS